MWVKGKTDVAIKHHLEYNHMYVHSVGCFLHVEFNGSTYPSAIPSLYVPLLGEPHME